MKAQLVLLVAASLLVGQASALVADTDSNVAGLIHFVSGNNKGMMRTGSIPGMTCQARGGQKAVGTTAATTLVAESSRSLCFVSGQTKGNCITLSDDLVGPIIRHGSSSFAYTVGDQAFVVPIDSETPENLGFTLSAGTYMTCAAKCYIYSDNCESMPSHYECRTLAGAQGGIFYGRTTAGEVELMRTSTAITDGTNTLPIDASYGSFEEWALQGERIIIAFSETTLILDFSLNIVGTISGGADSIDVAGISTGTNQNFLMVGQLDNGDVDLYVEEANTPVTRSAVTATIGGGGHMVAFYAGQFVAVSDTDLKFFDIDLSRASDTEVSLGFTSSSVRVVTDSGSSTASACKPIVVESGEIQVFTSRGLEFWSTCKVGSDAGCNALVTKNLNTNGDWTSIFIALMASFAIVPTSIYAYRTRKICRKPESRADVNLNWDQERGINYDPAYEAYANQFAEKSRKASTLEY